MELIEGDTLMGRWNGLDVEGKQLLAEQIRNILTHLRGVRQMPPEFVGMGYLVNQMLLKTTAD